MVQKAFFAFLLEDMRQNPTHHDADVMRKLEEHEFKYSAKTVKILSQSSYNNQWIDKCERSLHLAKNLGNIYTGSLYNGLISLICDDSIDLSDKRISLFSYGSGCAASLFSVRVKPGYKNHPIYTQTLYQQRLDQRIKVSPYEFERWMKLRENMYGKCDFVPTSTTDDLYPGTFYLSKCDDKWRRFYEIKGEDTKFNWTGEL